MSALSHFPSFSFSLLGRTALTNFPPLSFSQADEISALPPFSLADSSEESQEADNRQEWTLAGLFSGFYSILSAVEEGFDYIDDTYDDPILKAVKELY